MLTRVQRAKMLATIRNIRHLTECTKMYFEIKRKASETRRVRKRYTFSTTPDERALSFDVLNSRDEELFFRSIRMDPSTFTMLLNLLASSLKHVSRDAVQPSERLFLTLVYLAHGSSIRFMSLQFKLDIEKIRQIVLETTNIMWRILSPIYLSQLKEQDWCNISKAFLARWSLPNCVGALDGRHIKQLDPQNKDQRSIVLIAACDAHSIFTCVDVGVYGKQDDNYVFTKSTLGKKLLDSELDLPLYKKLPYSENSIQHYFIANDSFPLDVNIMKPYLDSFTEGQKITNDLFSRAHSPIVNAFGVLTTRWLVLRNTLHMNSKNAEKIVKATVVLHNFLKLTNCPVYATKVFEGTANTEGTWCQERVEKDAVTQLAPSKYRTNTEALKNRNLLSDFFNK